MFDVSDNSLLEWPNDDAYRSYVDSHWLNVLATFVAETGKLEPTFVCRCFHIVRIEPSGST